MWNLFKSATNELIYSRNRLRLTEQTYAYTRRDGYGGEGTAKEAGIDMYILLYLKYVTKKDLVYSTGNSSQYSEQ